MNKQSPTKIKMIGALIGLYILLPVALFILSKHFLFLTTYLSYLFIGVLIFFLASPFGKLRFNNSQPDVLRFTFRQWLGTLIAGQVFLFLFFYSFVHTALSYIPAYPQASNFFMLLAQQGLHPWSMIAVLSVLIGYYYYCEKQPALLISALPSLAERNDDVFIKRVIQMLLGVPTTFVLTLSIAFGALQLAGLIAHVGDFAPSYELNFINIILGLLFFLILSSKSYKKLMNYLSDKEISIGSFLLGFMIALSVLFTIANVIAVYLHIHPLKAVILSRLQWNLLLWMWWTGWAGLFASFVARISSGRSIREVILGVMLLPVVLLGLFYLFPINFKLIAQPSILLDLLALIGPFTIIFFLSRVNNTLFLTFGFMPRTKSIMKPDKTIKFIPSFLQIVAFLCFAYLLFGMNFLSLVSVTAVYSSFILFLIIAGFFVKRSFRNLPKPVLSTEKN